MIVAGLPIESWLLIVAAVGIGLAVEIAFFRAHRRAERRRGVGDPRSRDDVTGEPHGPGDVTGEPHDPDRPGP